MRSRNKIRYRDAYLKIFLSKDRNLIQIVKPPMDGPNKFDGNWNGLARSIAGSKYYGHVVVKL